MRFGNVLSRVTCEDIPCRLNLDDLSEHFGAIADLPNETIDGVRCSTSSDSLVAPHWRAHCICQDPRRSYMLITPYRRSILIFSNFVKRPSPGSQTISKFLPTSQTAKRRMTSAMAKRLEGKTVVVTGASSGIGRSIGLSLSSTFGGN